MLSAPVTEGLQTPLLKICLPLEHRGGESSFRKEWRDAIGRVRELKKNIKKLVSLRCEWKLSARGLSMHGPITSLGLARTTRVNWICEEMAFTPQVNVYHEFASDILLYTERLLETSNDFSFFYYAPQQYLTVELRYTFRVKLRHLRCFS